VALAVGSGWDGDDAGYWCHDPGVTKVVGEKAGLRGADVKVGTTQVTALPGPGGAGRPVPDDGFFGLTAQMLSAGCAGRV
jgi:hypothetical protein